MMEYLINLDHYVFRIINQNLSNSLFDLIFPNITDLHKTSFFGFVLTFLMIFWIYKEKKKGVLKVLGLLLTFACTDVVSHHLIKKIVQRPRPPLVLTDVNLKAPHFGGYSFTSNHAANTTALATYVSAFVPQLKIPLTILAVAVSFSRVYVGVHFPSDVIAGALIGFVIALYTRKKFKFFVEKSNSKTPDIGVLK